MLVRECSQCVSLQGQHASVAVVFLRGARRQRTWLVLAPVACCFDPVGSCPGEAARRMPSLNGAMQPHSHAPHTGTANSSTRPCLVISLHALLLSCLQVKAAEECVAGAAQSLASATAKESGLLQQRAALEKELLAAKRLEEQLVKKVRGHGDCATSCRAKLPAKLEVQACQCLLFTGVVGGSARATWS